VAARTAPRRFDLNQRFDRATLYEKSVLGTVWPHKPEIVRPIKDGANQNACGFLPI